MKNPDCLKTIFTSDYMPKMCITNAGLYDKPLEMQNAKESIRDRFDNFVRKLTTGVTTR